jgi:hypothetical protein
MIPLLLLRFILSITNDSPTIVEIYLIYYEWFPYFCWDLLVGESFVIDKINLNSSRGIIRNKSDKTQQ